VITLIAVESSPSIREATEGPRRRRSSFRGSTNEKSVSESREMVKVGFIILPESRRPAKLRGVEKGLSQELIEKESRNSTSKEYVDAQGAFPAGG
jgi:hypothetical protein